MSSDEMEVQTKKSKETKKTPEKNKTNEATKSIKSPKTPSDQGTPLKVKTEKKKENVEQVTEEKKPISEERDPHLLGFFWDLASVDESVRKTATKNLLQHLINKQNEWEESNNGEPSLQLKYSLKRLTKGLFSSRDGARQGFATALTEILRIFSFVNIEEIYEMISSEKVTKSMRGQEIKDINFGKLFGFLSLIRSGRFQDSSLSSALKSMLTSIVSQLLELSKEKHYLLQPAYEALALAIEQVTKEVFQECISDELKEILSVKSKSITPEVLGIAIHIHTHYSIPIQEVLPKWKRDLFHPKSLAKLANILKETTSSHPKVHSIWKFILKLFENPSNDLQSFWKIIVDENLLQSTNEKKFLAFVLFQKLLAIVNTEKISVLFSQSLMKCLIHNLSNKDNFLHSQAQHVLRTMIKIAKEKPSLRVSIVMQLIGEYGNKNFDLITKTTTVETLLSELNAEEFQSFLTFLQNTFLDSSQAISKDPELSQEIAESQRIWALNQIYSLTKQRKLPKQETWIIEILQFFMFHGFFSPPTKKPKQLKEKIWKKPEPVDLSPKTLKICQDRFYSLLKDLKDYPTFNKETTKGFHGTNSKNEFWTYFISCYQRKLRDAGISELKTFSEEINETRNQVYKLNDLIEQKVNKNKLEKDDLQKVAFQLLLSSVELQLYLEDDIEEVHQVLIELLGCYQHLFEKTSDKTEDVPEPIEVLTDVLISLLSKPSNLLRNTVEKAFRIFCYQLTPKALDLILQVINDQSEDAMDEEEEDEEEEEGEGEGEEGSSDEMEVDSKKESEEKSEDESESSSDESVDIPLPSKKKDKKKDKKKEQEEEAKEKEEEEELIANDDEMIEYDLKLAEMFKHMKSRKAAQQDLERKTVQFKCKVLDFIEVIIRHLNTNPIILNLIYPLIEAVFNQQNNAEAKTMTNKLSNILITKLFKIKDYPTNLPSSTVEELHSTLQKLFKLFKQIPSEKKKKKDLTELITGGIHLILRILNGNNSLQSEMIVKIFKGLLAKSFSSRLKVSHEFFVNFFKRQPWLGWQCLNEIFQGVTTGRNEFCKCEPFAIVPPFVRADKPNWTKEKFELLLPLLQKSFEELFTNLPSVHAKRGREVVVNTCTLFSAAKSFGMDVKSESLATFIEEKLLTNETFNDVLKSRFTQLLNIISNKTSNQKQKRKLEETQPEKEKEEKKKQKVEKGNSNGHSTPNGTPNEKAKSPKNKTENGQAKNKSPKASKTSKTKK